MLQKILGRPPMLWLSIVCVPAIIILVGLGNWQVERLNWKNDLTETVTTQLAQPPMAYPDGPFEPEDIHYRNITVTGRFHHDKEMHMFAYSRNGNPGYQMITPLEREDGSFVLVVRGWVPQAKKEASTRLEGQPEGVVTIVGVGRKGFPKAPFVADNVPDANIWFYADPVQMGETAGLSNFTPVYVYADDTPNPGQFPIGGQARTTFTNNHLEYALTWYGMVLVLIGVYIAFHRESAKLLKKDP